MIKKVFALVLVLCLTLVGCSQPSTATDPVTTPDTTQTTPDTTQTTPATTQPTPDTTQQTTATNQTTPNPALLCKAAIGEAKSKIADIPGIVFNESKESDISNLYEDAPKERLEQYQYTVDGSGGRNILNYSPKLMTEVTTNIINNCGKIGSVKFELNEADERVANHKLVYGLIDGSIKEFECVSPSEETSKLKWGQASC
ncbi:MAG: hypothetical protein ACFB2X_09730 [Rivularia sp. (in: cyanobacteria)]